MKYVLMCFLAVSAITVFCATSTRSFTNSPSRGSDPATLSKSSNTITVNLSAIQDAQVYRAVLNPYVNVHWQNNGCTANDARVVLTSGDTVRPMPPRYLSFDLTEAVAAAIASGTITFTLTGIQCIHLTDLISLDVMCDRAAPAAIAQVTGTEARFKDGDAMITFHEVNPFFTTDSVTCTDVINAKAAMSDPKVRYRIYRSNQPLTTEEAIRTATFVDEIGPLSNWNPMFYGDGNCNWSWTASKLLQIVPRLPKDDLVLTDPDEGIYVNRFTGTGIETAYYFVSHSVDGAEDFSLLENDRNAAGPVEESTGPGMVVKRVEESPAVWQFITNPTLHYYVRWECPPTCNKLSQAYDYLVAIPSSGMKASNGLSVALHCWGASLQEPVPGWTPGLTGSKGYLLLSTNQWPYDWWTAYNENYETLKNLGKGSVKPFTEVRILSFLYDFVKDGYSIDMNRVTLGGQSMGGTGTSLWGLRSGHIFSMLFSYVGVHKPSESPSFTSSFKGIFGDPAVYTCYYSNEALERFGYPVIRPQDSVYVWDYWDNTQWLRANPTTETPWIALSNGLNDGQIGWPQATKNEAALRETKRPYNFHWDMQGHGCQVRYPGSGIVEFKKYQSVPVFSNCSFNTDIPPSVSDTTATNSKGEVNRYFDWKADSIVDQTDRWEISLKLAYVDNVYPPTLPPADSCAVDITPRKLQALEHGPGSTYSWELAQGVTTLANGTATADSNGLVTIPQLSVTKTYRTLKLSCIQCTAGAGKPQTPMMESYSLRNAPNPFNPGTVIEFDAGKTTQKVTVSVYDLSGKLIKKLADQRLSGKHSVSWNGKDMRNTDAASGIYITRMSVGNRVVVNRMVLVR